MIIEQYSLEVSNTTIAPDGTPRLGLIVNGKFPGPVITASRYHLTGDVADLYLKSLDWGDTLRIHVKNNMKDNGYVLPA